MVRMVAGFISFVDFPLLITEKIFSYRLDTAKADEYNRAKERKGKENEHACADRSRKEIQGIQGYGQW
jgi:hypothetical protein